MKKGFIFVFCLFLFLIQYIWVNANAFSTQLHSVKVIEPLEMFSVEISIKNMPLSEAFESDIVYDQKKLDLVTAEETLDGMSIFVGNRILIDFNEERKGDMLLYSLRFIPSESFLIGECVTIELKNPSVSDGWVDHFGTESNVIVCMKEKDLTPPIITIVPYDTTPTNLSVTIFASTNKGTLNSDFYTFESNGDFTFVAIDDAGNVSELTVKIDHILATYQFSYVIVGNEKSIEFDSKVAIEGSSVQFEVIDNDYKIFLVKINGEMVDRSTRKIESIQSDIHVEITVVLNGDVNHDGVLTVMDIILIRRHLAGIIILDEMALFSGDMNNDSRISSTDMVRCRRKLVGLE